MSRNIQPPPTLLQIAQFALMCNASYTQSLHYRKFKTQHYKVKGYTFASYHFDFNDKQFHIKKHEWATFDNLPNQNIKIDCIDGTIHIVCKDMHTTHGARFDAYQCTIMVYQRTIRLQEGTLIVEISY